MAVPAQNPQEQTEQKQTDLDKNFAVQRKHYEKQLEQQKREYDQRIAQLEQERQSRPQSYVNDDDDLSDEPYLDRKTFKRELSRFGQDIAKTIDQKAEEKARMLLEQERQQNFYKQNPDFNQIMTPDMIQKFAERHPDTAESLLEMPDGFARQKLLYRAMKDVGIHKKEEPKPTAQDAINNNRKSMFYQPSGIGSPPQPQGGDFSPSGMKDAYQRTQALIKGRRGG